MKDQIDHLFHSILFFIIVAFTTVSPAGSGLGVFLRRATRQVKWRQAIGVNLAGLSFFAGVVLPQTGETLASLEIALNTPTNVVVIDTSSSHLQWPLKQFGISQQFSYYHPGIDLTDPIQTPIYPMNHGVVTWTKQSPYGYGKHILISHDNGMQSLYAHLSKIDVIEGDSVTKDTKVGEVGTTGWATGSHLHFEVYQDTTPVNPIEVLPAIK